MSSWSIIFFTSDLRVACFSLADLSLLIRTDAIWLKPSSALFLFALISLSAVSMSRTEEASEFYSNTYGLGDLVFRMDVIIEVMFVESSSNIIVGPLPKNSFLCSSTDGVGRPNCMDTITDLHNYEVSIDRYIF